MDFSSLWRGFSGEVRYTKHLIQRVGKSLPIWRLSLHSEGRIGYGEASPLPGWSCETGEEIESHLHQTLDPSRLPPSLHFAIESALLELNGMLPPFQPVPVAAFLQGETIDHLAEQAVRGGFLTAKVKLGHLSPQAAEAFLLRWKDRLRLRIDLNRLWKDEEVLSLFSRFQPGDFAYVEEPCQDPEQLHHFPLPFVLDETAREPDSQCYLTLPHCVGIVIKPTLSGGPSRWHHLLQAKPAILGGCYEGALGSYQIARLARLFNLSLPLGLGTLSYVEEENAPLSLSLAQGFLYDAMPYC